jgi:hypothetical protein
MKKNKNLIIRFFRQSVKSFVSFKFAKMIKWYFRSALSKLNALIFLLKQKRAFYTRKNF